MKKKGIIIGVVTVAALAAIITPRFFKKEQFGQAASIPILSASVPEQGNLQLTTDLIGTVEPSDVVYIYPKASGDVTAVHVQAGDSVQQGQVLCTIDTKQVDSAKNNMDTARVSMDKARADLDRMSILYSSGGISSQEYEQYKSSYELAEISYKSAKQNYETQVEYSTITAPISGKIELADMEVHDTVSQSNLICVIAGEGGKVVSFSVTDRVRGYVNVGDSMSVEKDGKNYSGTIQEVSTMADTATGLFKIKAAVPDDGNLPTGSSLKLSVISEKAENAMLVPVDAIYFEGGNSYLYTYDTEAGTVHKVQVETGIYDSEKMEVLSGITMDDLVVNTWSSELYEGAKAQLRGADGQIQGGPAEDKEAPEGKPADGGNEKGGKPQEGKA
ncbi:efflux RND transporter periplasmic adaptor subunit [Clostridium sp. AM58-1XD]|uniref:efflux RND transporter periplasmic adaptor subunit n=1 Tax=Clostridium sp. AM58-1XD TaxID=2292307 RepID=UPI000E5311DB|nr:efflux RND transporter periplasmic adaptor subunit [Clostridium sp. AM58-1XD]RGY96927.1 efflux RND transporter periplasmic adaptor subunit [Clostridium sp. AM58-1XD]